MPKMEETSSNIARTDKIDKPGIYHLYITGFEDCPMKKSGGGMIDGWSIDCDVVDGTEPSQKGVGCNIILNNPKMSHRDGGEFATRLQTRFLVACGLMPKSKLGNPFEFQDEDAVGCQFIAKFEPESYTKSDGTIVETVRMAGLNIWHVDDPEVAEVPKGDEMLAQIPAMYRWDKDTAAAVKKGREVKAKRNSPSKTTKVDAPVVEESETVSQGVVSFDDL